MDSSAKVIVKQGSVIGGESVLPNGKPYYFFKGIPYAEPPLGKLRFQAPVPLKKFSAPEIDCSTEGSICLQKNKLTGEIQGSEDCLFLNVFTPEIHSDAVMPVMVYIHGGMFINGSGNSENYNPLYLMQENIVVVTFNYRLGYLGFLSFPEGNVPGNAALKDQRLVLQWVQENIAQFRGDPNNVTLFGESAGSICSHFHVLSEGSKGLFHKAILQSGLGSQKWAVESNASQKTMELAKMLGCTFHNPIDVIKFLQEYENLEDFITPLYGPTDLGDIAKGGAMKVKPVIEKYSSEAVITRDAIEAMNEKNYIDIPLMIGCTSAEGIILLPGFIELMKHLKDKVLSIFIPAGIGAENSKALEQEMKDFYFKGENINKKGLNNLNKLLSDYFFLVEAKEAAEIISREQHKSALYFYRFDFVGELNLHKKKFKMENIIEGACHSDELHYIFQESAAPEPWGKRETKVVHSMTKMWAQYAKFSDPTLGCEWEPVPKINEGENFTLKAFVIDDTMEMVKNPYAERMDFWESFMKKLKTT